MEEAYDSSRQHICNYVSNEGRWKVEDETYEGY